MKSILIIEDAKRVSGALEVRLKHAGYDVRTATDGRGGLKLALKTPPDLVLLDICLPKGSGLEVAQALKLQLPEVPFLFLTASRKPDLWKKAQELGAVGFLQKPFESEKLLAVIARSLDENSRTAMEKTMSAAA